MSSRSARSANSAGRTVSLVACSKKKRLGRARPAEDLYGSTLFQLSRAYAEANGKNWFILSAKHELLGPRDSTKPYNRSLNQLSRDERRKWAERVYLKLKRRLRPGDEILMLAGKHYREDLCRL